MTKNIADRVPAGKAYFPPPSSDAWESVDPESAGWDASKLEAAFAYAEDQNSTGLVLLRHGRILVERYWRDGSVHAAGDVASVQKSFTALLVGIAREQGLLDIDDPVSKWLGEGWSNAAAPVEARISLRHLLTMTSGLDNSLASEAEPGTAWFYNTAAYHLLKDAIEAASGRSIEAFSRERLFGPIGLQDTDWRPRPNMPAPLGARAAASGASARLLTGLVSSTRDLARFGLLVIEGCTWAGLDVLADKAYLDAALSSSQDLNPAYGYLWWLNGRERYLLPGRDRGGNGAMVPAAPPDMVCALGAGDKKVYVCPDMGLVVARHGGASGRDREDALSSFDNELWSRIMAAAPVTSR